jgi:hypothetical protein
MKNDDIVLAIGQSANSGECGACYFFGRRGNVEYDNNGYCKFKLPPTRVYQKQVWDGNSQPLDTVYDVDSCNFWKSDGKTYIVSKRVKT